METNYYHYTPSPADLALAAERQANKRVRQASAKPDPNPPGQFRSREWVELQCAQTEGFRINVTTWNMLAQCLVRRELFPESTCLKASQRGLMLFNEILSHGSDVLCLQEVDRTEKLFPVLKNGGYSHHYVAGARKRHGCLIAWVEDRFSQLSQSTVTYDEQEVRSQGGERERRGGSFLTRNIASMVALQLRNDTNNGVIVATTHLFWHPGYTYERARQAGILLREVMKFRETIDRPDWPCVIAGDFNFEPTDPAYSLLFREPLSPEQETKLVRSRVVHRTIDATVAGQMGEEEEADGEESDPDKVITNARPAVPADGLLSTQELQRLYSCGATVRSIYEAALRECKSSLGDVLTFGDRVALLPTRQGAYEPAWTAYAHYWKSVLDYIFVIDPPSKTAVVHGFLKPHRMEDLEPSLPKTKVCGSDHISLKVELGWGTRVMDSNAKSTCTVQKTSNGYLE